MQAAHPEDLPAAADVKVDELPARGSVILLVAGIYVRHNLGDVSGVLANALLARLLQLDCRDNRGLAELVRAWSKQPPSIHEKVNSNPAAPVSSQVHGFGKGKLIREDSRDTGSRGSTTYDIDG